MRKSRLYLLVLVCPLTVLGGEYYQAIRVLRDPFQKPNIPQTNSQDNGVAKAPAEPSWTPQLKATLRAGRNSMANINGKIIKLGETINGHQLIGVGERSAVFVKNKQRIELTIEDEPTK